MSLRQIVAGLQRTIVLGLSTSETASPLSFWTPITVVPPGGGPSRIIGVPNEREWHILNIWVEYTSDATQGDRIVTVEIRDTADNIVGQIRAGAVQAASLDRVYNFGPSCNDLDAFRDTDWLMTPIPPTWIIPAGYDVHVYDQNAVAAGDATTVRIHIAHRVV